MPKPSGEAAPETATKKARDVSDDVLNNAAALLGLKFPGAISASAATAGDEGDEAGEGDGDETKSTAQAGEGDDAAGTDDDDGDEIKPKAKAGDDDDDDDDDEEDADGDDETKSKAQAGDDDDDGTDDDDDADLSDEEKAKRALAQENADYIAANLKNLPPELKKQVQGVLDKRIGKITAKAHAETDRLSARVEELATELEEAKAAKPAAAPALPGVHPLMLAESETVLEEHLSQIEAFEDFAADNPDGFEGDQAKGLPAWTPDQIRKQLRELRRVRERVIPAARANLQARAVQDAELKKTFAPMFDRKSEDYRSAQALLKTMPELRRHPNASVLVARLILGERALAALTKPAAKSKPLAAVIRKAPRVPGGGAPAKGGALDAQRGQGTDSASAVKNYMKAPSSGGLAAAVAGFL